MKPFGEIAPGGGFVKAIDGGAIEINKIYIKNRNPLPEGTRSGTAESFWVISISDTGIEMLPTGEPPEEFEVGKSVTQFNLHKEE